MNADVPTNLQDIGKKTFAPVREGTLMWRRKPSSHEIEPGRQADRSDDREADIGCGAPQIEPGNSHVAVNSEGPTGVPESSSASQDGIQHQTGVAIRQSLAFAQIVSVLARSHVHKFLSLADLEWLVVPPLLNGQFAIAEAMGRQEGLPIPVAIALWATVSPEVDKRLSENLSAPIRLRPDEWRSGDILWLIETVGDYRVVPGFLRQLSATAWSRARPKMRVANPDGSVAVKQLDAVQGT